MTHFRPALTLALLVLVLLSGVAVAQETAGDVCPPGTTKYETNTSGAGTGYEYGAEHATITVDGSHTEWQAITVAGDIARVCVKSGNQLYWPPTADRSGAFDTPDGKDVSHVVLYMETPNAIGLARFEAQPIDQAISAEAARVAPQWLRNLMAAILLLLLIVVIVENIVQTRRQAAHPADDYTDTQNWIP